MYIRQIFHVRTHVYAFLFSVKKNACSNYREFDLEGDLVGGSQYMVFIGPAFQNTTNTCLKRVGHGGDE